MRPFTSHQLLAAAVTVTLAVSACGDDDDAASTDTTSEPPSGESAVTVTAADYSFGGIPETLDAGDTELTLVNEGDEVHELALFRRNDGTTQPVDELLSLPEDQVLELLTPVTDSEQITVAPGETTTSSVALDAGEHIAICLVPVGLTDFDTEPPTGAEPHAAHGMVTEFTVR